MQSALAASSCIITELAFIKHVLATVRKQDLWAKILHGPLVSTASDCVDMVLLSIKIASCASCGPAWDVKDRHVAKEPGMSKDLNSSRMMLQ